MDVVIVGGGVAGLEARVRLRDGSERSFDALLVAPGARAVSGVEGASTWWPGGDPETYGGLLQDIDEGYSQRIVIAVPPGAVWPLPAYELALMTAGQTTAMGHDDVTITGGDPRAARPVAVRRRGQRRGDRRARPRGRSAQDRVVALRDEDGLLLQPSGERVDAQRVFSVPRLLGPAL